MQLEKTMDIEKIFNDNLLLNKFINSTKIKGWLYKSAEQTGVDLSKFSKKNVQESINPF